MLFMNAYSKDRRLRVLAAVDRGIPRKEVTSSLMESLLVDHKTLAEPRHRETGDVN
jgi:hypothetical protein